MRWERENAVLIFGGRPRSYCALLVSVVSLAAHVAGDRARLGRFGMRSEI